MSKKHKERIKSLFILLLTISAVALSFVAGIFDVPMRAQTGSSGTLLISENGYAPLLPTQTLVNFGEDEGFVRGSGMTDIHADTSFEESLRLLREALTSAGQAEEINARIWREALSSWGILFHFSTNLPLSEFTLLMGQTENPLMGQSETLYLSLKEAVVFLYFVGEDGQVFRAATDVPSYQLGQLIEQYQPNGGRISFDLEDIAPRIQRNSYNNFPVIQAQTAHMYQYLELLLSRFDFNPNLVRYIESDGVRLMVEDGATLRIFEDGLITYHYQGANPRLMVSTEHQPSLAEAIRASYVLASLVGIVSGEAEISFRGYTYQNGQFVIEFGYALAGTPILGTYPAARIVIDGRYVREVSLFARNFHFSGEHAAVLPRSSAQLAAGREQIDLFYVLQAETGQYLPRWILLEESGE